MMPAAETRPEIRIDPSKGDPSKKLVTESSRIEDFSLTKTPLRGVPPAEGATSKSRSPTLVRQKCPRPVAESTVEVLDGPIRFDAAMIGEFINMQQ